MIDPKAASGEEQQEFERALTELSEVLYKNEQASDALLGMIQKDNKVETTIKAVVTLITQMDEKIDIAEAVFGELTKEAVDRLVDLSEAQGMTFTEKEIEQIAMGAWEGVMGVFGDEESVEEDYSYLSKGMSDVEIKQGQTKYQELMGKPNA